MMVNGDPLIIIPFMTSGVPEDSEKRLRIADISDGGRPKTAQSVANGDALTPM